MCDGIGISISSSLAMEAGFNADVYKGIRFFTKLSNEHCGLQCLDSDSDA